MSNLYASTIEAPTAGTLNQQINWILTGSQRQQKKRNTACQAWNVRNGTSKTQDTWQIVCFCCSCPGHKAKDPLCPAIGKTCSHCGKQGHFAGVCKGAPKQAKDMRNDAQQQNGLWHVTAQHETSDVEYLFAISGDKEEKTVSITVAGTLIPVIIDSGASVNVLNSATFNLLMDKNILLKNSTGKVYPYSSEMPLPVKETFSACVSTPQL